MCNAYLTVVLSVLTYVYDAVYAGFNFHLQYANVFLPDGYVSSVKFDKCFSHFTKLVCHIMNVSV